MRMNKKEMVQNRIGYSLVLAFLHGKTQFSPSIPKFLSLALLPSNTNRVSEKRVLILKNEPEEKYGVQ